MADQSPGGGPEAPETTGEEGDTLLMVDESEALADADSELRALQMGPGQHAAVSYTHLTLPTIYSV